MHFRVLNDRRKTLKVLGGLGIAAVIAFSNPIGALTGKASTPVGCQSHIIGWSVPVSGNSKPCQPVTASVNVIKPRVFDVDGGTKVKVAGKNLRKIVAVKVGSKPVSYRVSADGKSLTFTAPKGTPGITTLTFKAVTEATTLQPSKSAVLTFKVVYRAFPEVKAVSPNKFKAAGGTAVKVTGTHLRPITSVLIGTKAVSFTTSPDGTTLKFTAPKSTVGATKVTFTAAYAATVVSPASKETVVVSVAYVK